MRFLIVAGCLAMATCGVSGCGRSRPSLVKVSGKVTLDGVPLEGAQVAFQPISDSPGDEFQRPSTGQTDAQGQFIPQTYLKDDGLRAGKYRVAVIKREMVGTIPAGISPEQVTNVRYKWITPKAVADPVKSGIEVQVSSSGMSPSVIELKSASTPEID